MNDIYETDKEVNNLNTDIYFEVYLKDRNAKHLIKKHLKWSQKNMYFLTKIVERNFLIYLGYMKLLKLTFLLIDTNI